MPSGRGGRNGQDQKPDGSEPGVSRSMKTGQKKRLLGGIKKSKRCGKDGMRAIEEEERLQSSKDITAQCVDFCEATTSEKCVAVLQHAPSDLRGGTFLQHPRVRVATVDYQENPHLCMQILHAAMFQVFRGAYILLPSPGRHGESGGPSGFLTRSTSSRVCLSLSGFATVITNVADT